MTFEDNDLNIPRRVVAGRTPKVAVHAFFGKHKKDKPVETLGTGTGERVQPVFVNDKESINQKYVYSTDDVVGILNWESYSITMDFTQPSNSFEMSVGDKDINADLLSRLKSGQLVGLDSVYDGSKPLMNGYLDGLEVRSRRDGSYVDLHGRNFLGIVCDSQIDPWCDKFKFTESTTLKEAIATIFADFDIRVIAISNNANRSLLTGVDASKLVYTTTYETVLLDNDASLPIEYIATTHASDPTIPATLKKLNQNLQSIKPHFGESYMAFAERLCRRFGLHLWGNATGDEVIIGQPNYDQEPIYTFTNVKSGQGNNVLSSKLLLNYNRMPALIVAKGFGSGKVKNRDIAYQRIKCAKTNDFLVNPDQPSEVIQNLIALHPSLQLLPVTESRRRTYQLYGKYFDASETPRVIYVEDTNSKTNSEIENFISRALSEHQREAMKIQLTVQDHQQDGKMYSIDTVATVNDETLGINAPFWVQSVTYKKSRSGGTTTDLTLIPLYSMEFGAEES